MNDLISPALTARIKAIGRPGTAIRDEQAARFLAGLDVHSVRAMGDRLALDLHERSEPHRAITR